MSDLHFIKVDKDTILVLEIGESLSLEVLIKVEFPDMDI